MNENEMLEAIRGMLQEELKPIHDSIETLKVQNKAIKNKLEEIDIRLTNLEYQVKKGNNETRQDIDTLVEVLEAKGILPKAL